MATAKQNPATPIARKTRSSRYWSDKDIKLENESMESTTDISELKNESPVTKAVRIGPENASRRMVASLGDIPVFTGAENIKEWTRLFKGVAKLNGWSDGYSLQVLPIKLKELPNSFVDTLPEDVKGNLENVLVALENQFGSYESVDSKRDKLFGRFQGTNEPVELFMKDLARLYRIFDPKAAESDIISLALRNIKSEFVDTIINAGNIKLSDLIIRLIKKEQTMKHIGRVNTVMEADPMLDLIKQMMVQQEQLVLAIRDMKMPSNASNRTGNEKANITCYYCGKQGHMKKDCRKMKSRKENVPLMGSKGTSHQNKFH